MDGSKPRSPAPYRELSTLLRDPTAARRDEALDERTRARIIRALATFDGAGKSRTQKSRIERQAAIISRCDLGGQLHKVVASDLGISMRTFYRERLDAFARLREALDGVPDDQLEAATEAGDGPRIALAWTHQNAGRTASAIAALDDVASGAREPALQAVAWARLASLWYVARDDARSAESLTRAKRALALLGAGATRTVVEAEINASEAERLHGEGAFASSVFVAGRVAFHVQRCTLRSGPNALDALERALLCEVHAQLERGDAVRALETARAARSMLSADEHATGQTGPALDAAVAEALLILEPGADVAREAALSAYEAAASRGLPLVAGHALRIAAFACAALDDEAGGLVHARAAQGLLENAARDRHTTRAALALAEAFAELGQGDAALSIVNACAIDRAREDIEAGIARVREADALLALGRYREAATRGREAARILGKFESRRLLGEAMLACSRAALGSADPRGARASAVQALKHLGGASWPTRVLAAQRLAGRDPGAWRAALGRSRPARVRNAG
jgi:tetratricopeptide (TPR) repeat protein